MSVPPVETTENVRVRVFKAARAAATLVVIGLFVWALLGQADALSGHVWRIEPLYLAAASSIALARGVPVVYPWWRIVSGWGHRLPWSRAVRIYFHSGLARYVPGQWWFVPSRVYLAEREGIRRSATAASTALETLLLTGSALSVALLGAATIPSLQIGGLAYVMAAGGVALVALLAAAPGPLEELVARVLYAARRETFNTRLSPSTRSAALAGCYLNWLLYGLLAATLLGGVSGGLYAEYLPAVVGLFAASVLGGALSLFVPQGLVVREGVLVYLLNTLLGISIPEAVAAAALTRLYSTGAEGIWALAAILF